MSAKKAAGLSLGGLSLLADLMLRSRFQVAQKDGGLFIPIEVGMAGAVTLVLVTVSGSVLCARPSGKKRWHVASIFSEAQARARGVKGGAFLLPPCHQFCGQSHLLSRACKPGLNVRHSGLFWPHVGIALPGIAQAAYAYLRER